MCINFDEQCLSLVLTGWKVMSPLLLHSACRLGVEYSIKSYLCVASDAMPSPLRFLATETVTELAVAPKDQRTGFSFSVLLDFLFISPHCLFINQPRVVSKSPSTSGIYARSFPLSVSFCTSLLLPSSLHPRIRYNCCWDKPLGCNCLFFFVSENIRLASATWNTWIGLAFDHMRRPFACAGLI